MKTRNKINKLLFYVSFLSGISFGSANVSRENLTKLAKDNQFKQERIYDNYFQDSIKPYTDLESLDNNESEVLANRSLYFCTYRTGDEAELCGTNCGKVYVSCIRRGLGCQLSHCGYTQGCNPGWCEVSY